MGRPDQFERVLAPLERAFPTDYGKYGLELMRIAYKNPSIQQTYGLGVGADDEPKSVTCDRGESNLKVVEIVPAKSYVLHDTEFEIDEDGEPLIREVNMYLFGDEYKGGVSNQVRKFSGPEFTAENFLAAARSKGKITRAGNVARLDPLQLELRSFRRILFSFRQKPKSVAA